MCENKVKGSVCSAVKETLVQTKPVRALFSYLHLRFHALLSLTRAKTNKQKRVGKKKKKRKNSRCDM